jgi:hypothetical protein
MQSERWEKEKMMIFQWENIIIIKEGKKKTKQKEN